ncbi:cutinase family protein (plasmid) [Rhodococcus pyridinivorans]|uniref:cutinase family protein n=1 Tax=Rhodococcus TaxID=1827 RepID=UPI0007D931A7|nr:MULTISPECIES: cutinase family protein [Rhodococcus]MCT7293694.1 cutinase family protein [Rhodococcus sp. PAE-6]QXU56539.1 cutinase family protein [Rhodococcus sp. LW-XY12]UQB75839.1 cutinase family protein [Rhodococcus ruber]UVT27530.1 cutinase family protein [Rhodococcus pyridinivorans]
MPVRHSRSRRTVALVATATVASGSALLTAPVIAHAAPTKCAATFNLFIPGTWETDENADPSQPVGMLKPIADALENTHGSAVEVYTLPYMARAFDNGHTYADSKADAVSKAKQVLADVANSCPRTKFTMIGYSQGADAAGDIASDIGNGRGPVDASRVLAVGLLADPGAGTKGSATVGPRTSGQGIADPRPQGMGALSGRVASICDPGDLYCSIEKGSSPLLGSLGSILSKSSSVGAVPTAESGVHTQLAAALTSDFSDADLPALGTEVATVGQQLTAPTVDIDQVADTARSIAKTLAPLTDLLSSGAANPAANGQLLAAPVGTAEHTAGEVLTRAGQSDLKSAFNAALEIADTASTLAGGASASLPSSAPEIQTLADNANLLTGQVGPLVSTPAEALSSATSVLSVLKPTVVVNQVLNVATGVTSLDLPGILNNLTLLPQKVAALDAHGAHQIAGELNNQFSPLVTMAAEVDMRWVSHILAVIPDPSGATQIAALVASILSNVDVIRLANIVGQIQEIAWAALEKLFPPPGIAPDPIGAGAAMTGLLPVGLDLASVAVDMLSGKATKTPPELLGKQTNAVSTSITTEAANLDLPQLSDSVVTLSQSPGAQDLAALVSEGLSAASFFTSGAHTNYNTLVVDNAGRNAIQWLSDWLNLQIGRAV